MKDLIVVAYQDRTGAEAALDTLRTRVDEWPAGIVDVVAVRREYDGRLRLDDSYQITRGEGRAWGMFWGTLVGSLLTVPFTAGLSTAAAAGAFAAGAAGGAALGGVAGAGDAKRTKDEIGLSDKLVQTVSAALQPGTSALLVVLESEDPERPARYFRGTGGTIVRTSLTAAQRQRIEEHP